MNRHARRRAAAAPESNTRPRCVTLAMFMAEHGPISGCDYIFEQLDRIDAAFPGLTFSEFCFAAHIAVRFARAQRREASQ
jgi:hypothetical protein